MKELRGKKQPDGKHKEATEEYLRRHGLLKDDPKDMQVTFKKYVWLAFNTYRLYSERTFTLLTQKNLR